MFITWVYTLFYVYAELLCDVEHDLGRQHRQTENQQKILNMAEQLLSRIGLFIERADLLEANINTLQKNYGEMRRSLDGRMGIVQKANEMKSLGVKEDAKHRIPNTSTEEE